MTIIVISRSKAIYSINVNDENGSDLVFESATFAGKTWKASSDGDLLVQGKQISKYYEPLEVTHKDGSTSKVFLSGTENDVNYHNLGMFTHYQNFTIATDQSKSYELENDIELVLFANSYTIGAVNYSGTVNAKIVILG